MVNAMNPLPLFATLLLFVPSQAAQLAPVPADYIKASNTGAGDAFGARVSLSGDLLAVGSPYDDSPSAGQASSDGLRDSGAVHVYRREGASWVHEAYIKAPNPGADDTFGASVALSGSLLAVGSPGEDGAASSVDGAYDDNLQSAGAVYVFRRQMVAGTPQWTLEAYVKAPNAGSGDYFGYSAALLGDTLAVGSPLEDGAAPTAGAVYTYRRNSAGNGARWIFESYIKPPHPQGAEFFGWSLLLSEDALVAAAPREGSAATGAGGNQLDTSKPWSGAVFVYRRNPVPMPDAWRFEAYLKASNPDQGDHFGYGLAMSGDVLAVGAPYEDGDGAGQASNSQTDAGSVYVFKRTIAGTEAVWGQVAYLKAAAPGAGDCFGMRLAIDRNTLAVGAVGEDSGANGVGGNPVDESRPNSGAVFLYQEMFGAWTRKAYVKATNPRAYARFGQWCDIEDGSLVVGADGESGASTGINGNQSSTGAPDAGAVYEYAWRADDCNQNGVADDLDIAGGMPDCDRSGVLDRCEIASGLVADADHDGLPDNCQGAGIEFCFGDGSERPCPCGEAGGLGRGCATVPNPAGALLRATGRASVASDTMRLHVEGVPPGARVVILEGTRATAPASLYGGLRCLGGLVCRLSIGDAESQALRVPSSDGVGLHSISTILVQPGRSRYYQAVYHPTGSLHLTCWGASTTNAVGVLWVP